MAELLISNIDTDGEGRAFRAHGHAQVGSAGGVSVVRGTFEPGWRWSHDVAPIAGTESCQVRHLGYVVSGRMSGAMDDGTTWDVGPGDLFDLAPGHDAWVDGDEPCILLDVSSEALGYALPAPALAGQDRHQALVRRGYAAFNTGDVETLMTLMAHDVIQHVPGSGPLAGTYKGIDNVLGMYGKLAELTDGTFRAHLLETHSDGSGHVLAHHQIAATRNGVHRVSRGSILFTFIGEKASDLLEMRADQAGDDAFLS